MSSRPSQIPPSVAFLLSRLGYEARQEMGAALAEFGLELREFGLMRLLADAAGSHGHGSHSGSPGRSQAGSQRALAALLDLTPNRMVALVDGLEAKGLIERRPHPEDRRAHAIRLTEAGAETFHDAMRAAFAVEATMCAPLESAEREQLLSLLRKLAAARDERPGAVAEVHPGMLARDDRPATS